MASYVTDRLKEEDVFDGDEAFAREVYEKGYGILGAGFPEPTGLQQSNHSEEDIREALARLGKTSPEDELNCGGCGYPTCRDMAKAMLDGLAETEMCVTKMRKDAETKVDILLSTIPHGVVIVDSDLAIAECNKLFIKIFEDYPDEFLDPEGLRSFRGYPVSAFVPFAEKFREQFFMSKPQQYRFRHGGKIYRITFFLVESKELLGAMFEDITKPSVRREAVVEKAEEVIRKSMTTVQQIASLLGDNAAETEVVLNSIIEEFNVNNSEVEEDGLMAEGGSEV